MRNIGLALSGGGFRAMLFHLGVVRFLRDAKQLQRVSHIACVSGGSILGAHLVQNWTRYTGSDEDFENAAGELIRFAQLDVRNRILRRVIVRIPLYIASHLFHRATPITRVGLLQHYYGKYLFGDRCMYELPAEPELHILSTNVSEGSLTAFTRSNVLTHNRGSDGEIRFGKVSAGLTPIALAVAASSAFPAFFPPAEISHDQIGADAGEFPNQLFTDGGVFDNLGVRMFRWLKQSWLLHEKTNANALLLEDIIDIDFFRTKLAQDDVDSPDPIGWLSRQLTGEIKKKALQKMESREDSEDRDEEFIAAVRKVILEKELYRQPEWKSVRLRNRDAQRRYRDAAEQKGEIARIDRVWLNRHLLEAAFHQFFHERVIKTFDGGFERVIVSHAGQSFRVDDKLKSRGLFGTAVRAADILFDRVGQLEIDDIEDDPSFRFGKIADDVDIGTDIPHFPSVIQRRLRHIRTDFDRFSPTEINGLVGHGYSVARELCRNDEGVFGKSLPDGPPWQPMLPKIEVVCETSVPPGEHEANVENDPNRSMPRPGSVPSISQTTKDARQLQRSAQRRLWTVLFDLRDRLMYVVWPLILVALVCGVWGLYHLRTEFTAASEWNEIVNSFVDENEEFRRVRGLLDSNPEKPFSPSHTVSVKDLSVPDLTKFRILRDVRIIDLRNWQKVSGGSSVRRISPAIWYRQIRAVRSDNSDISGKLRLQFRTTGSAIDVRCLTKVFPHRVLKSETPGSVAGRTTTTWEIEIDVSKVPVETPFKVEIEAVYWDGFQGGREEWAALRTDADTDLIALWILFPQQKRFRSYQLLKYKDLGFLDRTTVGKASRIDTVYQIAVKHRKKPFLGWAVINAQKGHIYECRWKW